MISTAKTKTLLYEQVADSIRRLIEEGSLKPGDRVPSVRRLSRHQKVSISTVLQAFLLLENRGLIEARPQSGFYVKPRTLELPPEPRVIRPPRAASTVSVDDLVLKVYDAARDPSIIPLGAACAQSDLFPQARLSRLGASLGRRLGARINDYDLPPGLLELRRQLARRALDLGCRLTSEEILTTCGCTEAVAMCLQSVAGPGDTIAVESPTYYGFLRMIQRLKMKALEIPTDPSTGIDLNGLEAALRKRKVKAVLVMANFNNPLGSCMPEDHKRGLVELAVRYDTPVIEDDIYGDLAFDIHRPPALKAFDTKGLVMFCSSFAKTLAPGYRVGWVSAGRYHDEVVRCKSALSLSTPTPLQWTIAEFLQSGGYDHMIRGLRRTFAQQVQRMSEAVVRYFPEGTRISRPQGGFVLWVEMPEPADAMRLFDEAIAAGISIAPGPIFSARQGFRNCLRLNCGHPWSERIDHAVATLGRLATAMKRP
ncbi:MAG TPA: PLP-dependent aminotransferase family protein [Kiritimatiellia bacterium]|nr:PLP-dependent aminotransferase family protein [Kiritimatiellia bacterium]HMP33792.1 PLP-dependent aminotransferase family protein [Kiritimatiellia bacterium]